MQSQRELTLRRSVGHYLDADEQPSVMKKKRTAAREHPDETIGSKLAAEIRKKANGLTSKQRADYFRKGMAIIHGGRGKEEAARS